MDAGSLLTQPTARLSRMLTAICLRAGTSRIPHFFASHRPDPTLHPRLLLRKLCACATGGAAASWISHPLGSRPCLPAWDEYVDWSLLLERRSFMYLFLSVNAFILSPAPAGVSRLAGRYSPAGAAFPPACEPHPRNGRIFHQSGDKIAACVRNLRIHLRFPNSKERVSALATMAAAMRHRAR